MNALHKRVEKHEANAELDINPVYFREKSCEIPRYRLPEHGVLPRTALQVVRDELILDGTPGSTWPRSSPRGWSRRPSS